MSIQFFWKCVPFTSQPRIFHWVLCPDLLSFLILNLDHSSLAAAKIYYIVKKQVSVINVYRCIKKLLKIISIELLQMRALSYIESIATDFLYADILCLQYIILNEICLYLR